VSHYRITCRASALESSAIQNGQANTVTSRESMTPVKRFSITSIIPPEAARTATHTVKGTQITTLRAYYLTTMLAFMKDG
jgi:hypothetical protein